MDFSLTEVMVVCGSALLIVLLLTEILDWSRLLWFAENEYCTPILAFGYADHNGPHTWKTSYPEGSGYNQSPINITTRNAIVVQPSEPFRWINYQTEPLSMTITNDGNAVVVNAYWSDSTRPYIQGGPLSNIYDFFSILLHWGPSNEEGSEHTLDYVRYAMELQVVHVKREFKSPFDAILLGAKDSIVIVTFFLQITQADNPYLDHIITNLWRVACPGTKTHIRPFPLEWIISPFEKNYYTYNGSLTQPPCSEIVTWIVQPEPIAISSSQVVEFRKICSVDGPLQLNCRPVQHIHDRDVYFYA